MRERLKSLGWLLLLTAVICWFFHECLFDGCSLVPTDMLHNLMLPYGASVEHVKVQNHYTMDALTIDYPWGVFWQQTVRNGELPLWNPYILGGHPILAESMPAVLSPIRLLYVVLPAERAFALGIVLAFVLAGLFMFALLREIGRSRLASFIGSVAWALNSGFVMWYWRVPSVFCWAPLVVLFMERSVRRDSWGDAFGGGIVLGIAFLSGSIQAAAHIGFLCAAYGACLAWWQYTAHRGRATARVAVVLALGVLVSAAQWLPTLELMRLDVYNSMQSRGTHASLRHTLLGIPCLITFLFPGLTGSTETYDLLKLADGTRGDFTGYIGVVPFTLALISAMGVRERRVRWLIGIIGAVVVITFFTPLVKYLYHRFFIVAVFAASVLAAFGADMLIESSHEQVRIIRRTLATMVALCGVLAVGMLAVQWIVVVKHDALVAMAQRVVAGKTSYAFAYKSEWFQDRVAAFLDHYRLLNTVFWLPILCVLCVAVLWWASVRAGVRRTALCVGLVLATVLDVTVLGRQLMPQIDLQTYPLRPSHPTLTPVQSDRGLFRVLCLSAGAPFTSFTYRPNWLMAYGIQDLWGNCSLAPECLESLFPYTRTSNGFSALLDLLNAKYLFVDSTNSLPSDRFELLAEADGLRTYRNKHCLPRAFFVPCWEKVSDRKQILALMTAEGFDPRTKVFLEQQPSVLSTKGDVAATARIQEYTPLRVVVNVQCEQPGMLVLADTWYPGWKVRVDGAPSPLYRADWVLRAVAVPAGEHRVEFYYAPLSFWSGAALSLLTVAGVLVFGVASVWRRGKSNAGASRGC